MSPEGGPRKLVHLKGEVRRAYQEIKRDHGVELGYEARRSLAEDPEAAAYLRGFQYYLDHKDELLTDHRGKWMACTAEGILTTASSYTDCYLKVEQNHGGRRAFYTLVRSPGRLHGIPRVSLDHPPITRR